MSLRNSGIHNVILNDLIPKQYYTAMSQHTPYLLLNVGTSIFFFSEAIENLVTMLIYS